MEITPQEFKDVLNTPEEIILLDCRTTPERELACIEPSIHVPMTDIKSSLQELLEHADKTVVVHCHHGVRSLQVTQFLRNEGFDKAVSLAGGIDRWSLEIDQSVPRY